MNLLSRIKELCDKKNMTLTSLERELDFSRSSMRLWESSEPSIDKVSKVAKFFGVSIDYLYGDTDDPQPTRMLGRDELPADIVALGVENLLVGAEDLKQLTEDDLRALALRALEEIERRKQGK